MQWLQEEILLLGVSQYVQENYNHSHFSVSQTIWCDHPSPCHFPCYHCFLDSEYEVATF